MCDKKDAVRILGQVYNECSNVFEREINDAYLYGSYARGDYHEGSDIDIFLTVDVAPDGLRPYREAAAKVCSDLGLEHDIMISAAVESLSRFRRYADVLPYYSSIVKEGIPYAG